VVAAALGFTIDGIALVTNRRLHRARTLASAVRSPLDGRDSRQRLGRSPTNTTSAGEGPTLVYACAAESVQRKAQTPSAVSRWQVLTLRATGTKLGKQNGLCYRLIKSGAWAAKRQEQQASHSDPQSEDAESGRDVNGVHAPSLRSDRCEYESDERGGNVKENCRPWRDGDDRHTETPRAPRDSPTLAVPSCAGRRYSRRGHRRRIQATAAALMGRSRREAGSGTGWGASFATPESFASWK
jgi:hypothetical protein